MKVVFTNGWQKTVRLDFPVPHILKEKDKVLFSSKSIFQYFFIILFIVHIGVVEEREN